MSTELTKEHKGPLPRSSTRSVAAPHLQQYGEVVANSMSLPNNGYGDKVMHAMYGYAQGPALQNKPAPVQMAGPPQKYTGLVQLKTTETIQNFSSGEKIHKKLSIGSPDDSYEREADQVMRIPDPAIQRKCAACEAKEKQGQSNPLAVNITPFIQAKGSKGGIASEAVSNQIQSNKGGGSPLGAETRSFMESRVGTDFSNVRIHTGDHAVQMSEELNAQAFTVGNDIYFNSGKYSPESSDGKHLLAHELTHVVQQSGSDGMNAGQNSKKKGPVPITPSNSTVIARLPAPPSFGISVPGLSIMPPVIKEGYDGKTYTAIKNLWGADSWERRWRIYDAEDQLLYESSYTWPQPTLYIPTEVIAKGKAGGKDKPWSVWHEVTETMALFGGDNEENFPYTHTKFYVYETWNDYMADPNAKLSNVEKDASVKSTPLDSSIVSGARSVIDYGSVVAMHEAYLREIYDASAKGITETAKELVSKGVPQGDTARWANEARNQLKASIRADGNPILKKVFEARNLNKYGNKLGPAYDQLYQKYAKQGLPPEEINKKIIGSSGKANIKLNRWSGRLRVAGRIMLAIDIALAGVRVYLAPEGEKTKVVLEEVARIGGALAFGALGAKGGAAGGAAVGALFGGAGAVPGAIIGGIIGAIGGAIFGGWLGKSAVEKLYEMLPPSDCVFEGEFIEEEQ